MIKGLRVSGNNGVHAPRCSVIKSKYIKNEGAEVNVQAQTIEKNTEDGLENEEM